VLIRSRILREVTIDDYNDYNALRRLRDWRIKNRFAYVGDYEITTSSIRKWLKSYVLDNPHRHLYWILINGEYIGHIGKIDDPEDYLVMELSDVSRGKDKFPGMMAWALNTLTWTYETVTLKVRDDNTHAIEFYEKNGYKGVRKEGPYRVYERHNKIWRYS
jgi:hypothetical protein